MNRKEFEHNSAQLVLLYEVGRSLSELIDLERLMPYVITKTKEILDAESSAVLLLDESRRELYFPYTADVAPEVDQRLTEVRFPADRGIAGWVLQHGVPQLVPDVSRDARWYPEVDRHTGMKTRSLLCAPLRTHQGIIGVLSLRNKLHGSFTGDDLDLLGALCGSIAVALENALLYEKLKQSEAQLREEVILLNREMTERKRAETALREEAAIAAALARVGRELISSLDAPVLLERLCQMTAEVLGGDRSHTLIWRREDDVYVSAAGHGGTSEEREIAGVLELPREALTALLCKLDREDAIELRDASLQAVPEGWRRQFGPGSHLCMALRHGKEIIGIQVVGRRGSGASFAPLQHRIARGIAQLASMALHNARLVEELDRANRMKSDFVSMMSHELRTPLHIMMGYTNLLLDKHFGPLAGGQQDALRRIDKSAQDLLALINATLDLGRLETGQISVDSCAIALPALMREIEDETRELQRTPDLLFVWDVPPELPVLWSDPVKLKVIVKNLIDNAAKFTREGRVHIRAGAQAGGIEISVADTGIGIAPDVLPVIFDSFRQGERPDVRRYGGLGLGLYIVRRLVELLEGAVNVESQLGRGSVFRIWLPLALSSAAGALDGGPQNRPA